MNITGTIDTLLTEKGKKSVHRSRRDRFLTPSKLMSDKNIGALLVLRGDKLVGVFSERDYTRKVALKGKSSKTTQVHEIISTPAVSVEPHHTVEGMHAVDDRKARAASAGDTGRQGCGRGVHRRPRQLDHLGPERGVSQMEDYISGRYPAEGSQAGLHPLFRGFRKLVDLPSNAVR